MSDAWSRIHEEREELASTFDALTPAQWSTPSLCAGWSVQNVAGHLIAAAETGFGSFYKKLAQAGFRFSTMSERDAKSIGSGDPHLLGPRLRQHVASTQHPPGPVTAMLGEAVVHGEDIRRPLGIAREVPEATRVAVANFYKNSNLIVGAKRRIAGLHLRATDADWSNGDGPEVSGPLLALVLAMTGRYAAHGDLSGEGLSTLSSR